MFFNIIASGSKGNATLVFSHDTIILIDLGIPLARVNEELEKYQKTYKDIDALIVTHDHADHYRGIKSISPKKQYALAGTLPSLANEVELFTPFKVKNVTITPFMTSHDASNPCGYKLEDEDSTLVYMTDTGRYLSKNTPLIKNPDYLIIESNHDIQMLLLTNRPIELKNRIMSDYGHLCNEDSAFAALEIIGDNTKEIVLAHLSEEANTPEHALKAYEKAFRYAHVDISRYKVRCANQWTPLIGGNNEDQDIRDW